MANYIERESVMAILEDHPAGSWRGYGVYSGEVRAIMRGVEELPAADVAPARRGRWLMTRAYNDIIDMVVVKYTCSACGEYRLSSSNLSQATKYCPNCGAKMEG